MRERERERVRERTKSKNHNVKKQSSESESEKGMKGGWMDKKNRQTKRPRWREEIQEDKTHR